MARGPSLDRVARLQSALKKAKEGDMLSLTELAVLWGISKGAFVNVREKIPEFPEGEQGQRNSMLYPARAAIKAMLEYETRADEAEQERQRRAAEIMGMKGGRGRRGKQEVHLPPSEMLKLSRLRAEIEERERAQGEYIHRDKVRATGARVYGVLNDYLSQLETRVDPNGLLPADQRIKLGELGRTALLAIHRDLSDTLGVNADDGPGQPERQRKSPPRPRRA